MKRSPGVTASAVISIIGSSCSILFGGLMVVSSAIVPLSPPPNQPVPPVPLVVMVVIMAILFFGFGIWGIVSAIGLLRLRNWARISFAVYGGLLAFFALSSAFGVLMAALAVPQIPQPNNVPPGLLAATFAIIAVVAFLFAALGIFWAIYFNRKGVKIQFMGEAARFAYLVLGIGSLLVGAGLLKKRAGAFPWAVAYSILGLLNSAASFLIPGSRARMLEVMREAPAYAANMQIPSVWASLLIGIVAAGVPLLLLLTSRKAFLAACKEGVQP
jgi:hypothetical protein